jgi:excisionase family DNA binding protein
MEGKETRQQLLRVSEAAELLAVRESTVRAWLLNRRIGRIRVGRRSVLIPMTEINRLIQEGTVPAREQR